MTEKQKKRVNTIINYLGKDCVQSYIRYFYPNADLSNLTKQQAQKIITGLNVKLPCKPISNVHLYY